MARQENTSQPGIVNWGGTNSFENTAFGEGAAIVNGEVVSGTKLPDTKNTKDGKK